MKRIFSRYSLNVFQLKLDEWPYPPHTHNFYELILINEGHGRHLLNGVSFSYGPGHIFLLTPDDHHSFEIDNHTIFTYIKFTEQLFVEKQLNGQNTHWLKNIEKVLYNPNTTPECIVRDKMDKEMIFSLSKMLLEEFIRPKTNSRTLILELFGALMVLVSRNISKRNLDISKLQQDEREKVQQVLLHIRQHMDKKELLSQKYIAQTFNLSPNYISNYLKKHTGLGLQMMITETRLKTAERLLKQSTYSVSQIANRVGFNDASHMNKTFQKYRGKNPTDLR
ncbi:helix-turn-helix domain-containing protein [Galbibacter sp. BG1]|uniref:helix-turn-helix domain-containing protein n=1 Tax=Galbibacter sp. BG1 TaxID=1170699 RepID=UPI0015BDE477|nr:helix-turn-helix domain-containing protein [Galbibacter sp. BG1]QLE02420.1 helix-turn-helix domain-containing protein [Galbibacter sp. BG1]